MKLLRYQFNKSTSLKQLVAFKVTGLRELALYPTIASQRFGYSSSASPQPTEKETNKSADGQEKAETEANGESAAAEETDSTGSNF